MLQGTLDSSVLDALQAIIEAQGIAAWDGFNQSGGAGQDGYDFELRVIYEGGTELYAHGYMLYPDGYDAGHAALSSYLEGLTK